MSSDPSVTNRHSETIQILHVDDNPDLAELAATFLIREDDRITVEIANSASDGVDLLAENTFDCIISDYDMPRTNGIEFLQAVRETHEQLPFILYTGKGSEEVASDAISAGVTDYVQKQGGTDHYKLLANRVANAVYQYRTEQSMERTQRRFQMLVEESTDSVLIVDTDAIISFASSSTEHVLERTPEDLIGRCGFELIHPEDQEFVRVEFEALVESPDQRRTVEFRYQQPDGSYIWVEARGRNLLDEPLIDGVIIYARDISSRKKRELELEQTERRYQAVFHDPNILVGLIDTDGTVLDINQTAMEYIDMSVADLQGEPFWQTPWFNHSEAIQAEVKEWIDRAAANEYIEFEANLLRPNGEPYTVEGVFRPVTDDEGEVVSLLISNRDVTNRKERERELQQLTDKYETIFNHTQDAVFLLDVEDEQTFRIVEINEREAELLGRPASEVTGNTVHDLYDEETAERATDAYRRCLEAGEPITDIAEYELNGETRAFESRFQPVWSGDEIVQIVGVSREITEQRKRQQELERYETIIESIDDIAFVVDETWTVEYTSPRILDYVDASTEDLEGQPVMTLAERFITDENGPGRFESALKRTFDPDNRRDSPERLELGLDFDDEEVVFEYQFSPMVTDGETTAVVVTIRDITQRRQREENLRETTQYLQTVLDAAPDGIIAVDTEGRVELWNRAAERIFGWSEAEVIGKRPPVIPDEYKEAFRSNLEKGLEEDGIHRIETERQTKDGEQIDVRMAFSSLRDEEGEPTGILAIVWDITDRIEREKELQRVNELLEQMEQLAAVGAWEYDVSNEELVWTKGTRQIHEVADDTCHPTVEDGIAFYHPDDRETVRALFEACVEDGEPYEAELRIITAENNLRWILTRGERISREGHPYAVRGYIRDITDRKQREQEHELALDLLDQTEEIADVGGWEIDTETQAVFWTDHLFEMLGVDYDEEPPLEEALDVYVEEDRPRVERAVEEALAAGESFDVEARFERPDGELRWFRIRGEPMIEDGEVVTLRGAVQDITGRKRREQQLERQNDRLDEFASVVSHDLRTPLSMVEGRLELAREECESAHLDSISDATDRMKRIIDDVLWLAREGQDIGDMETVALKSMVENAWTIVADGHTEAELILAADPDRWDPIRADRDRLRQLLENLFRNAIDHAGPDVTVRFETTDGGFAVEDDGPGIPETERDRVFESGYSTATEGIGFGLAIVKQVVDAHGWEIRVTDGSEDGARFEITDVAFSAA